MPEGDAELDDEGLPDEMGDEEDSEDDCESEPEDLLRMKVESL